MEQATARAFAGLMEDYLHLPGFMCEKIEARLLEGHFEEVIQYVVDRRKEIEK